MSKHDLNTAAFLQCVGPLLESDEVSSMKQWQRHYSTTCFDHCLFVSYVAFRLARYFGWDYPADRSAHPGNQCLDHPEFALRNAAALCPDLSDKERNAIVSHMFPLAVHLPRSRVAVAVNLADKLCATLEVAHLHRMRRIQRWLPAPAHS